LGGAALAVSVGVTWLDLPSFEQYVWFSFVGVVAATVAFYLIGGVGLGGATTEASTPLRPVEPLGPRPRGAHTALPAEASDQPAAVAHQLAVGQLDRPAAWAAAVVHGSWDRPKTLPSGSVSVTTSLPPPTSRTSPC
jgi:hypothetical protein